DRRASEEAPGLASGREEREEQQQQGTREAQREQGPLGPGTFRQPPRGDLPHGTAREREGEQARSNEEREKRETPLIGETGEHVVEQDQNERTREQGPTGDDRARTPRRVAGEGRDQEERRRRDRGEDQRTGHKAPGPADRQRGTNEGGPGGDPEAPAHPVPAHRAALLGHTPRDDGEACGVINRRGGAQGPEGHRQRGNRRAHSDRGHRSTDAEGGDEKKRTRRTTVREEPERHGANPVEPETDC